MLTVYKAKDIFTGLGQFTLNYIDALRSVELFDFNITLLTLWQLETEKKGGYNFTEGKF